MRLNRIGAGTDEIMLDVIGRSYGLVVPRPPAPPAGRIARPIPPSPRSTRSCAGRPPFVEPRARRPTRRSGRTRGGSRTRSSRKPRGAAATRAEVPEEIRRAGRRLPARRGADRGARAIGSGGTAAGIGAHVKIATPPIWRFGTEEQKRRYLVPAIRGEKIGALAITEPGAGSDVAVDPHARRAADGGWVVNGEKTYITNGVRADFIVTAVEDHRGQGGHHGISFLIVERGEGVSSAKLEKLGWHASDTATIAFEDVFVPEENLLGELNGGFKLIMANFQWERLAMALGRGRRDAAGVGAHRAVRARAHRLRAPAGGHQAIRHSSPTSPRRRTRRAASPTTRCAGSSPARNPCGRSRWPSS